MPYNLIWLEALYQLRRHLGHWPGSFNDTLDSRQQFLIYLNANPRYATVWYPGEVTLHAVS